MADVTRAVLLPDAWSPSDGTLKTLALYWDEVVVTDGAYRARSLLRHEELSEAPKRSDVAIALESAGIVKRHAVDVPAESFMPRPRPPNEDADGMMFLSIERDDEGRPRFTGTMRIDPGRLGKPNADSSEFSDRDLRRASAALEADSLMARASLGRELAAANNLAPIATSLLSHLASMTETDRAVPIVEGALLSVALQAFVVDADTSVETLVRFREDNAQAVRRFRGAMSDLGECLRQSDLQPEATLAAARDVYRTRVEPDLGLLEDRLKESRIKFFTRSVFGAAALAVTPLTAPAVVEGGARLGAQSINYRFSRARLLEEHPYGYLHRPGVRTATF